MTLFQVGGTTHYLRVTYDGQLHIKGGGIGAIVALLPFVALGALLMWGLT